jgi:hypothetical protein
MLIVLTVISIPPYSRRGCITDATDKSINVKKGEVIPVKGRESP